MNISNLIVFGIIFEILLFWFNIVFKCVKISFSQLSRIILFPCLKESSNLSNFNKSDIDRNKSKKAMVVRK